MKNQIIYIRLLNEGTEVYRPVDATILGKGICILGGEDVYNREDEEWEFEPGDFIQVERRVEGKKIKLFGVKLLKNKSKHERESI